MGKRIAILQSNYIPWKGYFDMISKVDEFVIYDSVQYTKNDWRNRNLIKVPGGTQWITIPVYHKLDQKIKDTVVADENWNFKHWNTLVQFYGKAKYFNYYRPFFGDLYRSIDTLYLSEINRIFIEAICKLLDIDTKIIDSSLFELYGDKTKRIVDICKKLGADTYISGAAAKDYMEMNSMEGINVEWMEYDYPEYNQLWPPFKSGVTALDMIFNEGKFIRNVA